MVLKRNLLGWRFEEYWFDEPGYTASTADIAALRTHGTPGMPGIAGSGEAPSTTPPRHTRIPERTLLVPLDRPEEAILEGFATRAKTSIRQAAKAVRIDRAQTPEERALFYDAYLPFAAGKGLLLPNPAEETGLEIFLARDGAGDLLQAAAFLPAAGEKVYRYRYGVYVKKSQANAILIRTAILRARELGFTRFDLGGITPGARPGSPEAGINFFKSQFGGHEAECHLYLRGTRPATRLLFRFLQATGLAARHHALASLAGRFARR
jgi:hypothetical protein